jgi:hypothetical protein
MSEGGVCSVDRGCDCEDVDMYSLLKRVSQLEQELHELKQECAKRWTVSCKFCAKVATQDSTGVCQVCRHKFMEHFETSAFAMVQRLEMEEIK